jgi:O-glycosyl hydrolase
MLTPPPWMKTNNDESGKGKATLKPKLELEYAEYLWAFLAPWRATAAR